MRHRVVDHKFGRSFEHKKSMFNNMATSLFKHERIITTLAKARELRPKAERMITWAKRDTLHGIRLISKFIKDKDIVTKLTKIIAPRYKDINGGYTRMIKYKNRKGDNTLTVIVELTMMQKKVKKDKKGKDGKEAKAEGKQKELPAGKK